MEQHPGAPRSDPLAKHSRVAFAAVVLLAVLLLAAKLWAPYEMTPGDQGKQAQYVLDCVQNDNWIAPREQGTIPATKPPLYTWCAAAVSLARGDVNARTVRVPALVSGFLLVMVVWWIGLRLGGVRTALAASLALLLSAHFERMSGMVRTDGLLALLLSAYLAVYLWMRGGERRAAVGIAGLCVLSALAWMTKGPMGALSGVVVAVHLWMLRERGRLLLWSGLPALVGAAVLLTWFLLAKQQGGDAVYDTMVEGELGRHLTTGLPQPWYYVLHTPTRVMPWTLLVLSAAFVAGRTWWKERPPLPLHFLFPVTWLGTHAVVMGLVPHQRPDLFYSAEPALFLLLAAALGTAGWRRTSFVHAGVLAVGVGLLVAGVTDRWMPAPRPGRAVPVLALLLLAAAAGCFVGARRRELAPTFAALLLAGACLWLQAVPGSVPFLRRASFEPFCTAVRAEAARRGARIVVSGTDNNAILFHLGLAEPPAEPEQLARLEGPLLVVAAGRSRREVVDALGPCDELAHHEAVGAREGLRLTLLAPQHRR